MAGVPLGEDGCKIRIGLELILYSIALARDILESSLEVKSNKDSGVVGFRKVLDGLESSCLHHPVFQHRTAMVPAHLATDSFFCCHH